jgi:enolase
MLNGIGNPTVEADVELADGTVGRGSTPSGASTGAYEALELRDGGQRYAGRGVLRAVQNVNQIIGTRLLGMDACLQRKVDEAMLELDGTANKSRLGGNAILAVSLAVANAATRSLGLPLYRYIGGLRGDQLPMPIANVMAGAETTGNTLDFEDHLAYPIAPMTFRDATRACVEVYRMVGKLLEQRFGPIRVVGGAWAPPIESEDEALTLICEAVRQAGYQDAFALGIDVAANLFYDAQTDRYRLAGGEYSREALLDYYQELVNRYPIRMLEDPFHEDDFEGFRLAKERLGITVVGDDLFVTNRKRLEKGIAAGAANALLFKVNQVGTITEALEAADTAYRAGYSVVASARSGDCEDVSVPDIVVAIGADFMKIGAPARGERNSKYNRFMRIEEELLTGVPVM